MSLDDLKRKRNKWVEANRENNFEEGIKKLLTDLYPDNAHFIFELLQNAEDPGATIVRFTLDDESLEFEHNGSRLFNLNDVESITSIGVSTKRNDPTKIGKFGVGFKAVFAYTNTPEIHSGGYHFRIRDMVVPEEIEANSRPPRAVETRFRFPFNHPTKKKRPAKNEIESALLGLGDNTLLFLSHIHTIEYLLPSGGLGKIQRIDKGDGRIEIHSIRPDGTESKSHWLRFEKKVNAIDEDGSEKDCRIAIAYALDLKEGKKATKSEWQVVPLDRGQVSIYFPAEKETSGLRFHIHAPFASTVARDSVRDSEANARLLEQIALLVAESLHSIKAQGMLSVNFLAVMPNPNDGLSRFYKPIREHIVSAFKNHKLTPTKAGTHARATALSRGPLRISDVIDDDDLSQLTGQRPPLWAANPPQTNQREDRFLDSLEIDEWGWRELNKKFVWLDNEQVAAIEDWLDRKDDHWMLRFYSLLGEALDSHSAYPRATKKIRLVRTEGASKKSMNVCPKDAHFAPADTISAPSGIHFVKRASLESSRSENQKRLVRVFLEYAGVRPFDEKALLERRLEAYSRNEIKPYKEIFSDIRNFLKLWKKDSTISDLFKGVPFLLGRDEDGEDVLRKPSELCLDNPYVQSGLAEHVDIHGLYPVSAEYEKELPSSSLKPFIELLKSIGVTHELAVTRAEISGNPDARNIQKDWCQGARWTDSAIARDHAIPKLGTYIAAKSITASRLIWDALVKADKDASTARFRPNQQYETREAPSQLVHHLKSASWIPDKNGNFRTPADMSKDELRDDFPYDDRNGLLTAIGFGHNARQRSAVYQARNESAKALGFNSADEAAELAALTNGRSLAELRSILTPPSAVALPARSAPNPERRGKGILEDKEGAPDRESVKRERSVIAGTPDELASARAYLRPMYTNVDGQLICQCCRLEMPFKINGMHFFEAVKLVGTLKQHLYRCRLALCPTCAAMYKHARETPDEELVGLLANNCAEEGAGSAELDVALAGKHYKLWFVGTHMFDVKKLLSSS